MSSSSSWVRTPALISKGLRQHSHSASSPAVRTPALISKGLRRFSSRPRSLSLSVRTPALISKGLRPIKAPSRRASASSEHLPDLKGIKTLITHQSGQASGVRTPALISKGFRDTVGDSYLVLIVRTPALILKGIKRRGLYVGFVPVLASEHLPWISELRPFSSSVSSPELPSGTCPDLKGLRPSAGRRLAGRRPEHLP